MAIPKSTLVWAEPMDPYDVTDYQVDCSAILEETEMISTYSITILAESALVGLTLGTTTYAPSVDITGKIITLWLSVSAGQQSNAAFTDGVTLPIEINITTNSAPQRKKQRTVAVQVIQR